MGHSIINDDGSPNGMLQEGPKDESEGDDTEDEINVDELKRIYKGE